MATSASRKNPADLYRPLSRKALQRGKVIADRYRIVLWREYGEWYGQGVEEPGAMGDGRTMAQCARTVRKALTIVVACHIDDGEPIVQPIVDQERRRKAG